jgi:hypothetical protein
MSDIQASFIQKNPIFNPQGNDNIDKRTIIK